MSRQAKVTETDQVCCLTRRRAYMKLPLQERRKRLAAQAERMVDHYEQESGKWCQACLIDVMGQASLQHLGLWKSLFPA